MTSRKIYEATLKLAKDSFIMNSYKDFYNGKGYFLTKNRHLLEATKRPSAFPERKGFESSWRNLEQNQKRYLAFLANVDDRRISVNQYEVLKKAFEKWNLQYYVVYYGADKGYDACNLFVGEAIYWAGKDTSSNGKYLSAKQISQGTGSFKLIEDKKNVEIGNIVAFGDTHVEIVTKINRGHWLYDDDFCSRGAGRGSSDFGTEKCEGLLRSREIDNENRRFFKIEA